jgi:hypothetical protein
MERDAFDPAEDVCEIGRRGPDRLRHVGEPDGLGETGFQKLLRPGNQASGRSAGVQAFGLGLEGPAEKPHQELLRSQAVNVAAGDDLEKSRPQKLQADVRPPASPAEQGMAHQPVNPITRMASQIPSITINGAIGHSDFEDMSAHARRLE